MGCPAHCDEDDALPVAAGPDEYEREARQARGRCIAPTKRSSPEPQRSLETPMAALGGVYEGIDGIRRFLTDVEDAAPDFRMELDGVEEVDSKRVLAFLRNSSTGRASGIRLAWPQTNVYDLVDGKISHIRIFIDRHEALKAVGLAE